MPAALTNLIRIYKMKILGVYRVINEIEMANDKDVYEISFNKISKIFLIQEGGLYAILENDEEFGENIETIAVEGIKELNPSKIASTLRDAKTALEDALTWNCVVKGYGTHSGSKYWRLPSEIKRRSLKAAKL